MGNLDLRGKQVQMVRNQGMAEEREVLTALAPMGEFILD